MTLRAPYPRTALGLTALLALASAAAAQPFAVAPPAAPFADVEQDHWAREAVDWLRNEGLLEGWGRRFHGRRTFTRYEMAEVLARYTERLLTTQAELRGLAERGGGPEATARSRALQGAVERLAEMVATHQVLLEDPGEQRRWRRQMRQLRAGTDAARQRLDEARRQRARKRRMGAAPGSEVQDASHRRLLATLEGIEERGARFESFDEPAAAPPRPKAERPTRLLAAAPSAERRPGQRTTTPRPAPRRDAGADASGPSPARAEALRHRLRQAWAQALTGEAVGPDTAVPTLHPQPRAQRLQTNASRPLPARRLDAPPNPDAQRAPRSAVASTPPARPLRPPPPRASAQDTLRLARALRAPPAPRPAPAANLESRLMDTLDEVRKGDLDPEQARVIGYLARLALDARRGQR